MAPTLAPLPQEFILPAMDARATRATRAQPFDQAPALGEVFQLPSIRGQETTTGLAYRPMTCQATNSFEVPREFGKPRDKSTEYREEVFTTWNVRREKQRVG